MEGISLKPVLVDKLRALEAGEPVTPPRLLTVLRKELGCVLPNNTFTINAELFTRCALAGSQAERKQVSPFCAGCPVAALPVNKLSEAVHYSGASYFLKPPQDLVAPEIAKNIEYQIQDTHAGLIDTSATKLRLSTEKRRQLMRAAGKIARQVAATPGFSPDMDTRQLSAIVKSTAAELREHLVIPSQRKNRTAIAELEAQEQEAELEFPQVADEILAPAIFIAQESPLPADQVA